MKPWESDVAIAFAPIQTNPYDSICYWVDEETLTSLTSILPWTITIKNLNTNSVESQKSWQAL